MKYLNSKGFSLVESLSAFAIFSIIVFSFLGWAANHESGLKNLLQNSDIADSMTKVIAALGEDEQYCTNVLGGLAFNVADPTGVKVNSIAYYDFNNNKVADIVKIGDPISEFKGIISSDIVLKPLVAMSSNSALANLEISFKKSNISDFASIVRRIPVYVTLTGSTITSCSISQIPKIRINNRICEIKNEGYSHYDVTTQACVDDENVTWFDSVDSFTAKCPTGYKAATVQKGVIQDSSACIAKTNVGASIPPRSYSNGSVDDTNVTVYASTLTTTTATCNFVYGTSENPSNYVSSIKCVPAGGGQK